METKKKRGGKNLSKLALPWIPTHIPVLWLQPGAMLFFHPWCEKWLKSLQLPHLSVSIHTPSNIFEKQDQDSKRPKKTPKYFLADGVLALNPIPFVDNFGCFTKNKNMDQHKGMEIISAQVYCNLFRKPRHSQGHHTLEWINYIKELELTRINFGRIIIITSTSRSHLPHCM